MNPVISREYVEKNYIKKSELKEIINLLRQDEYEDDGYYIAIERLEEMLEEK